jgi:1,2-diacylglycerol 3-alpha-glucosyltransferase
VKVAFVHFKLERYWLQRLLALKAFLSDGGDELEVVTTEFDTTAREAASLPIKLVDPARGRRFSAARVRSRVIRELAILCPDVVATVAITFPTSAASIRWSIQECRPLLVMDDARAVDVPRGRAVERGKKALFGAVSAGLIPAPSHVPSYVAWGLPSDRLFFGVDVVDNTFWMKLAQHEKACRRPYFLGVGRHVEKKNWARFVTAFREYHRAVGPDAADLILAGTGPDTERLQRLAEACPRGSVRFLGNLPPERLAPYYRNAVSVVLPSLFGETWGLAVNEAMACGSAVLVSRQSGCSETLVREGVNGWTFDGESVEAIFAALIRMHLIPAEERRAMGEASLLIIKEWDIERFVTGFVHALRRSTSNPVVPGIGTRLAAMAWMGRFRSS